MNPINRRVDISQSECPRVVRWPRVGAATVDKAAPLSTLLTVDASLLAILRPDMNSIASKLAPTSHKVFA